MDSHTVRGSLVDEGSLKVPVSGLSSSSRRHPPHDPRPEEYVSPGPVPVIAPVHISKGSRKCQGRP